MEANTQRIYAHLFTIVSRADPRQDLVHPARLRDAVDASKDSMTLTTWPLNPPTDAHPDWPQGG
jgi:hypothetical protein